MSFTGLHPQERVRAGLVVFVDLADFVDDDCRGFTYINHYNVHGFGQLLCAESAGFKRAPRGELVLRGSSSTSLWLGTFEFYIFR